MTQTTQDTATLAEPGGLGTGLAELRERLTRAYLSGDGAAVVVVMEQIAAAEQREAAAATTRETVAPTTREAAAPTTRAA